VKGGERGKRRDVEIAEVRRRKELPSEFFDLGQKRKALTESLSHGGEMRIQVKNLCSTIASDAVIAAFSVHSVFTSSSAVGSDS
jgi:hypothetical protein